MLFHFLRDWHSYLAHAHTRKRWSRTGQRWANSLRKVGGRLGDQGCSASRVTQDRQSEQCSDVISFQRCKRRHKRNGERRREAHSIQKMSQGAELDAEKTSLTHVKRMARSAASQLALLVLAVAESSRTTAARQVHACGVCATHSQRNNDIGCGLSNIEARQLHNALPSIKSQEIGLRSGLPRHRHGNQ